MVFARWTRSLVSIGIRLAAGASMLCASLAHADPKELPVVRSIRLEEAIRDARAHHPAVLASRARVEAARVEARIPGAAWYPTFGASVQLVEATTNNSTTTPLPTSMLDLPRIGGTPVRDDGSWGPHASTLLAIGGRQLLFDAGRSREETASLRQTAEAEQARAEGTELDVDLVAIDAYYAVLSSHELVEAAEQAVVRARSRREFVEAAVSRDLRPRVELTRADADIARFEVTRIRAIGSLRIARSNLAIATGAPEVEIDATPTPTPTGAAAAATAPVRTMSEEDIAQAVDTGDPALRVGRHQIEAQRAATRAIEARAWPVLSLTGALSGRAGGAKPSSGPVPDGDGWLPNIPNWSVGLVLSIPIYDPTIHVRAEASRARETALRMEVEGLRVTEIGLARQAHRLVDVGELSVDAVERSVAASRANYDQAEARFKAGLATTVEVSEAETLRAEAEAQLAVTRFELLKARASFARATGQRGQP